MESILFVKAALNSFSAIKCPVSSCRVSPAVTAFLRSEGVSVETTAMSEDMSEANRKRGWDDG